ncbi:MAG: hypothetical protein M3198_17230 [Actinomycetota bacterium]|nr:hypothetical protein [Actinomycetota bacterium]
MDMILAHVKDRTVEEAASELIGVLETILELPGMKNKPHHLVNPIGVNIQLLTDYADDARIVGDVIDNILQIRNNVPGTAERGTGGGHGEAKHSGILETLESALRRDEWPQVWDENIVEDQARYAMWRLLDYDPPMSEDMEVISEKVLTHFLSLRMAYPNTFEWLTDRESYLFTYLQAHRGDAGMPLPRVSANQVEHLIGVVHAAL